MWQCLNNVPRPLSHQHQKLQSSSHCFHCSTTCSPTHTNTHANTHTNTHSRSLTHSLGDYPHLCFSRSPPPSPPPSLPLSTLSYLCHWKDPPPLLFPPLSLPSPSPFSPSSISLSLPPSTSSSHYSAPSDLRCRSQGAVCSPPYTAPLPTQSPWHEGKIQKASVRFTVHTHRFLKTAPPLGVSVRGSCSWAYKAATAWKKEWM